MRSYSPLRYPGGKARLFNYTTNLINDNFDSKPIYIEAYAGGAALAIELLSKDKVREIHINDFDYAIYAFWYSLKYFNNEFIELVENAKFGIREWSKQKKIYTELSKSSEDILELGFATFYLNRTNRSGIITAGPIGGKEQTGPYKMNCRFNKEKLIEIILNFDKHSNNIFIYNMDGKEFIKKLDTKIKNAVFYLDPPYVIQGGSLYKNSFSEKDHVDLALEVSQLKNKWFLTYDVNELIKEIYNEFVIKKYYLSYTVQTKRRAQEYIIFSNNISNISIPKL